MLQPLTNADIRARAPAALADHAKADVSSRYTFVSTADMIDRLRFEGMVPVSARQSNARDAARGAFVAHELRFVGQDLLGRDPATLVGQTYPQVVLTNSHDRGSALSIAGGMFRLVCRNGMVVPDGLATQVKVRHTGSLDDVIEGVYSVVHDVQALPAVIQDYQGLHLSRDDQQAFAKAALELRESTLPVTPEQLLRARRAEDTGTDLWTVTNRVQENLVQGGLYSRSSTGRWMRTRPIKDIQADQKLNKALFVLAEHFRAHLS